MSYLKFPQFANLSYEHFYSGPRNNRQPSKASFVEFQSSDDAFFFLRVAKSSSHLNINGKDLKIKLAMTAINRKRNWSLRRAEELAKNLPNSSAARIIWPDRVIKCNEELVFSQERFEVGGTFHGRYASLQLP